MKKLWLLVILALLPATALGKDTARLRRTVYEKLKVPTNDGFYKDSLINNGIQEATMDIELTNALTKTDTLIFASNVYRRVVGRDSALKIIGVFKRKSYGNISNLTGFTATTEDKLGSVMPSLNQYMQDRVGDSLIIWIQPTPVTAETLWVKYSCFGKRYDTLWTGGGDSMQILNPENPLPALFEKLVPLLTAARLLTREAPFRNDVMEMLYREYLQAAAVLPEEFVKRVADLWPLPAQIRSSPDAAEPK